jgi:hypothetical protein
VLRNNITGLFVRAFAGIERALVRVVWVNHLLMDHLLQHTHTHTTPEAWSTHTQKHTHTHTHAHTHTHTHTTRSVVLSQRQKKTWSTPPPHATPPSHPPHPPLWHTQVDSELVKDNFYLVIFITGVDWYTRDMCSPPPALHALFFWLLLASQVDREFVEDNFNLYGLRALVP